MIKPRPPHQAADKFLRLAKLAVTLGMEFEDAAIGVDHELIASIGPALPRLSSALQTLSQDMRRQAMTPPPEPPPVPKPTPILDFLESKEQASSDEKKACGEPPLTQVDATRDTYAAFVGRNPLFTLEACDEAEAVRIVARVFPDRGFRFRAVTPQWAAERKLPCFQHWKEATIKAAQAEVFPGQLCDGYGIPQFNQDGTPLKACDLHAPDPKVPAERPTPARSVVIEAPASADLEDPATYLAIGWAGGKPRFWLAGRDEAHVDALAALRFPNGLGGVELMRRELGVVPAFREAFPDLPHLNDLEHSAIDSFRAPAPLLFLATDRPTGRRLFTILAGDEAEARDRIGMMLTFEQDGRIALEAVADTFRDLPDWEEFRLDSLELPPDLPPEAEIIPDPPPDIPAFPTGSPRDPLATLPIGDLDLRKPVLELLASRGIATAGQLFDELGGDVLDGLLSGEQEEHARKKILRWESERHSRIVADGSWLDEELTYAAFRLGDAPAFWAGLRERGATDAELRDAINKRFFVMGGAETAFRAGYYFVSGAAPAFFRGASKPRRGQEPALEGKHLVDAVRRLLAIPTREEPAKAPARRKAVKA